MSPHNAIFFEASHWPSDHMIRSRPLIGRSPKIVSKIRIFVSKILEENGFKDLRKLVSMILEENSFKDFGGNLFQRFWRKIVSKILEEICFKDFGGN